MKKSDKSAPDTAAKKIPYPKTFPSLEELARAKSIAPDIDPFSHFVLNSLLRVTRNVESALDRNMSEYGLTMGRYIVLAAVYRCGRKGVSTSELADSLGVTRATMTGLLDNLERDRLVERMRREDDRRRIDVRATAKAHSYLMKILPDHCDKVRKTFSVFNKDEMEVMLSLLGRLDESFASEFPKNSRL